MPEATLLALLLRAHDDELRTDAEFSGAEDVRRIGPVWLGRFGTRGFASYRDLAGVDGADLDRLIGEVVHAFASDARVESFEWKTRGHDRPADLAAHLAVAGLAAQEAETVMIGEANALAASVAPVAGVVVRRAVEGGDLAADVASVGRLHREVFGPGSPNVDEQVLRMLAAQRATEELWLAETGGEVIGAGRLSRVPGTRFAGLWGGAIAEGHRHRGIYRALTAARARSALRMGAELVYAECTEFSRPILARSGLVAVTTTTPWLWRRPA
ncbi:MAG: GNAT family N-acetyltransferase [Propionicimonas sp.]|uniref:GNAT family N-acetyltransferase n=1 Tax=Propionicimonas sp. TaxID=1955623 RepID=UPI003D0D6D7B